MSYLFGKLCDQGISWHWKNDVRSWFKAARNFVFTPDSNRTLIWHCLLVSYRIMMLTIARLCLQVIDYWYISQQRATLCLVLKHFLWHYSIPRWIMCDTVTRWCGQIGGANRSVALPHQIDLDKFNSKKWLCYTG